ncbi:hypothetical protein ACF09C_26390 [Streptomyces sp. NPDC014870]|uniref:hypothetical protein n=1 Tax=Streptomyces sp. NPDC014870 TaxID=3364925 RepID=UPI0036FF6F04
MRPRRSRTTPTLLLTALLAMAALAAAPPALASPSSPIAAEAATVRADPQCQAAIDLAIDRNRQAITLVDASDPIGAARANEQTMHDITRAAGVCPGHIQHLLERAHGLAGQAYEANSQGGATGVQRIQHDIESTLRDALNQAG